LGALGATAVLALILAAGGADERAREACPGHEQEAAFDRMKEYRDLVALYARGERARAVAGLAQIPDLELCKIAHTVELAAILTQRGEEGGEAQLALQRGKLGEPPLSLQAAVMLHWDFEKARHPMPPGVARRTEEPRKCPGRQTLIATRYARLLAAEQDKDTKGFARRFFIALADKCQWDACFDDADYWAREGLNLFPRDPDLLLAVGSVLEETATLGVTVPTVEDPSLPTRVREEARAKAGERERVGRLRQARALYEDVLAADDGLVLARVRLGRVYWRLGEGQAARAALEKAIAQTTDPLLLYLAHLFLGRVHEDAGRLEQAVNEYRLSRALDPRAQAAGVALSEALRRSGAAQEARDMLRATLAEAGRRAHRDPYWDYVGVNALHFRDVFAALREESLR
jgi:tetratricopeptide (TPR) repeat protein